MLKSISLYRLNELKSLDFAFISYEVRTGNGKISPINTKSKVTITHTDVPDFSYAFTSIENEPNMWFWDFYGFYSHMDYISSRLDNMFFVDVNPIARALMYFATCIELEGRRLGNGENIFKCVAVGSSIRG